MTNEKFYQEITLEEKGVVLKYYMLSEKFLEQEQMVYGVKIIKVTDDTLEEEAQISGIFSKEEDAEKFIDIIIKNQVTPISLRDIAEDYIIKI